MLLVQVLIVTLHFPQLAQRLQNVGLHSQSTSKDSDLREILVNLQGSDLALREPSNLPAWQPWQNMWDQSSRSSFDPSKLSLLDDRSKSASLPSGQHYPQGGFINIALNSTTYTSYTVFD